jgi:putative MFS transporter
MERFERKHLIVASALVMGVLGVLFGFGTSTVVIIAAGFLLTATSNVFSNGFHIYQAEIFPTRMRSTAVSTSYSLSRLSGTILPFISVAALDRLGPTARSSSARPPSSRSSRSTSGSSVRAARA